MLRIRMGAVWMTVADVADELDLSARTVLRWVERGDLPAVRLPGGRLRVSRRDFGTALDTWRTTTAGRKVALVDKENARADR